MNKEVEQDIDKYLNFGLEEALAERRLIIDDFLKNTGTYLAQRAIAFSDLPKIDYEAFRKQYRSDRYMGLRNDYFVNKPGLRVVILNGFFSLRSHLETHNFRFSIIDNEPIRVDSPTVFDLPIAHAHMGEEHFLFEEAFDRGIPDHKIADDFHIPRNVAVLRVEGYRGELWQNPGFTWEGAIRDERTAELLTGRTLENVADGNIS